MSIADGLRQAIRDCGQLPGTVAREARLVPRTVYDFLAGGEISTRTMERLAQYLGVSLTLTLTPNTRRRTR